MDTNKFILNCEESQKTEDDWDYSVALKSNFLNDDTDIIEPFDPRNHSQWKIGDQDNQGSCVGWAVADSCLRWLFFVRNNSEKKLSVRFIWMASKETDEIIDRPTSFLERSGTNIKSALDIARKYGCVLETDLELTNNNYDEEDVFYAKASRFKILNYFNLNLNCDCDFKEQLWKKWLISGNGPIIIRLDVDTTWTNADYLNPTLDEYQRMNTKKGHAAAIVGYNEKGFIVRNSWGENWGENGYAYATLNYANAAFTEAYGVCI